MKDKIYYKILQSGTEPLLRILVEARDEPLVDEVSERLIARLEAYFKPETGLELFGMVKRHIAGLHERGMSRMVGYELMSNGRVILVKVRAASGQGLPSDEEVEMVLDGEFVDRIEPLAQELVDGFHVPSFAHCPSERED